MAVHTIYVKVFPDSRDCKLVFLCVKHTSQCRQRHIYAKEKVVSSQNRLEMRCVQSHEADQTGHETSGGKSDNPSHEDEAQLPPVYS
jgi:hypothetical protein